MQPRFGVQLWGRLLALRGVCDFAPACISVGLTAAAVNDLYNPWPATATACGDTEALNLHTACPAELLRSCSNCYACSARQLQLAFGEDQLRPAAGGTARQGLCNCSRELPGESALRRCYGQAPTYQCSWQQLWPLNDQRGGTLILPAQV